METTYTEPRIIPAGYVRPGDQLALYATSGLSAGDVTAVKHADWRREIEWADIYAYIADYDQGRHGVELEGGRFIAATADIHVVIRETYSDR